MATNEITLSPLKAGVLALGLIVTSSAATYLYAYKDIEARIEEAEVQMQLKNLDILKQLQEADDAQAEKDRARIKQLEDERNAIIRKTPNGPGLDADDVERLRQLFQDTIPGREP